MTVIERIAYMWRVEKKNTAEIARLVGWRECDVESVTHDIVMSDATARAR